MQVSTVKNVVVKWSKGEPIPVEIHIKLNLKGLSLNDIQTFTSVDEHTLIKEIDSINLSLIIANVIKDLILKKRKAKIKAKDINQKLLK